MMQAASELKGYDAYGNLRGGAVPDPFGYCGEYYDNETGLIYLRNRYYDSTKGIFLTEDPAKDGLNWYSYCAGDPVNAWDPWGLLRSGYTDENGVYHEDPDAEEFGKDSLVYSSLVTLGNMWETYPEYRTDIEALASKVREIGSQDDIDEDIETVQSILAIAGISSANATDVVIAAGDLSNAALVAGAMVFTEQYADYIYQDDSDGTQHNALKHTMWNALMVKSVGMEAATYAGNAHEFGAEENLKSKNISYMQMDLFNNGVGRAMGENYVGSDLGLANDIVNKINSGQIWVVDWRDNSAPGSGILVVW